jgi:hypothetical protein
MTDACAAYQFRIKVGSVYEHQERTKSVVKLALTITSINNELREAARPVLRSSIERIYSVADRSLKQIIRIRA